jgi:hypothetical protein
VRASLNDLTLRVPSTPTDLTLTCLGATARFDDVPDYRSSLAYNEHWRRFRSVVRMAPALRGI